MGDAGGGWQYDDGPEPADAAPMEDSEATFQAITAMDEAAALATRLEKARAVMVEYARRRAIAEKSVALIREEYASAYMELNTAKALWEAASATARKLIGFTSVDSSHELT